METSTHKIINTLSYLIWVQNNRLEGYQHANESLNVPSMLKPLIPEASKLSNSCRSQLLKSALLFGGKSMEDTVISWASSHAWIQVSRALRHQNLMEIYSVFENGEHATQRAYEYALKINAIPGYLHEMLNVQKQKLAEHYEFIRSAAAREAISGENTINPYNRSIESKQGLFSVSRTRL